MEPVAQFSHYLKVRRLIEEARELGFGIVAFTPTEMLDVDRDAFEFWLKREGRKVLRAMRDEGP